MNYASLRRKAKVSKYRGKGEPFEVDATIKHIDILFDQKPAVGTFAFTTDEALPESLKETYGQEAYNRLQALDADTDEAISFASAYKAPAVFVGENNLTKDLIKDDAAGFALSNIPVKMTLVPKPGETDDIIFLTVKKITVHPDVTEEQFLEAFEVYEGGE